MKNWIIRNKKVVIIVASLVAFAVCCLLFLNSPIFSIKTISVKGNHYDESKVSDYLSDVYGQNGIFTNFHFDEREVKMEYDFPYMKNVTVKYVFPSTISVEYSSRVPEFYVQQNGMYYISDSDTYVVETKSEYDETLGEIFELRGMEFHPMGSGSYIKALEQEDFTLVYKELVHQITENGLSTLVSEVDVTDLGNVIIRSYPSLEVKIGAMSQTSFDLRDKLAMLAGIYKNGLSGESDGVLDLTGETPVFSKNKH